MAQRKLVRRPAARRDLANAVSYLRVEGGSILSHRFLDEVEATFTRALLFSSSRHALADYEARTCRLTAPATSSLPLLGVLSAHHDNY